MTTGHWLRVEDVSKSFGSVVALDHVNLDVERGEFVCLLGPSGCGKTTLLRIIGGFERQDAGEVWLRGGRLTSVPPDKRQLGMVFQNYALFPHLTVFDNVAFPLRSGMWIGRRKRPADLSRTVREVLRLVNLEGTADRRPSELSGGQAQRVALARAVVRRPDVILLDEPLSALDPKVRQRMRYELKSLQERLETTFVFVTHDQDEALSIASRIALMRAGRIEQVGAPSELYETPQTRFAAHFIGDQTFVRGSCVGCRDGRLEVLWRGRTLRPLDRSGAIPGSEVDVMLRPEDIRPVPDACDGLVAEVRSIAYRGGNVDVGLAVGEETLRMRCLAREFLTAHAGAGVTVEVERLGGVAFSVEGRAHEADAQIDAELLQAGDPPSYGVSQEGAA